MRAHTISLLVAGASLALMSVPAATFAEGVRLQVQDDLGTRAGARSFETQVQRAAHRLCLGRVSPRDLAAMSACQAQVRAEALAALTPAQAQAYAAAVHDATLASASPTPIRD